MSKDEFQDALAAGKGTIQLGGKTFIVSPPTDSDARSIAMFLRKRARNPVQALRDDPDFSLLPPDVQQAKLAEAAARKFDGQALDPVSAMEALMSVEGVRFMALVCLRKNHPDLTLEALAPLITDDNREAVFMELDQQTGMGPLGNSGGRPG